jgi:CubicO group peptidase (beta-lactamase class C family)
VISLPASLEEYLPELKGSLIGNLSVWNLLTHTTGIHLQTSKFTQKDLAALLTVHLPNLTNLGTPGSKVEYANISTYLLGEIILRTSGLSLPDFLSREIFIPLKMEHTMFCPQESVRSKIPPTEILSDGTIIQGIVHDESARTMGGSVGHAGLFSNALDLIKFINLWLDVTQSLLEPETLQLATGNHTQGLNKASGLGWHLNNKEYLGGSFAPNTFFHPGFTGTIIGGNRDSNLGFVFLSNCTYPHREGHALKNEVFQRIFTEMFEQFG